MCNESAQQKAYVRTLRRRQRFITGMRWGVLIAFLGLWEGLARLGAIDAFLLSSPSRMAGALPA